MTPQLAADPIWDEFRRSMPITRNWAFFDHAAGAPLSGPAQTELARWSLAAAEQGDVVWSQWAARIEEIRRTAARLIGAEPSEIGLVPNTTAGANYVAAGFPWRDGDNVITIGGEFPSNIYPWMNLARRQVEERRVQPASVEIDFDQIIQSCDRRTRLIAISWVGYATGWRIDVAELVRRAHERGVLVFLDAIQGLGVFPLDVRATGVDFLAADGHKWLLGPEGAGIFFMQEKHLDLLSPQNVGWNSVVHSHDFARIELTFRPEVARYEGGSQNMAGFHALGASLDLLQRIGLSPTSHRIADRVLEITALAARQLTAIGAHVISPCDTIHGSGIISFELPDRAPADVVRHCRSHGVVLNHRAGRLRLSPHAYNNEDDVERLITAIR